MQHLLSSYPEAIADTCQLLDIHAGLRDVAGFLALGY